MILARVRVRQPGLSPQRGRYFWPIERVGVERLDIPVPAWGSFAAWQRLLASWPRHWGAG